MLLEFGSHSISTFNRYDRRTPGLLLAGAHTPGVSAQSSVLSPAAVVALAAAVVGVGMQVTTAS